MEKKIYIYISRNPKTHSFWESYTLWLEGHSGFKLYICALGHIKLPLGGIFSLGETPEHLSGLEAVTAASTDIGAD